MTRQTVSSNRGVALLIVLACVVLLSGLVVAYFSRTTTDRQLSNSSFHQAKADELARSALAIVTSELKQEIVNGYPTTTVRNVMLSGTTAVPSLIRISAPTASSVNFRASKASSTVASANGRSISLARWNKHYLLPRDPAKYSGSRDKEQTEGTDPLPGFTAPSWIYITNQGPAALSSPNRSVIGRYAYAMYDVGALLDVNVAGYPTCTGTTFTTGTHMGSLAFSNLEVLEITGTTGVNNLVGWRNYATAQPKDDLKVNFTFSPAAVTRYVDYVLSNTNGFLNVSGTVWNGRTDQAFVTRQEMLAFCRATTGGIIPPKARKYLGSFSRAYSPAIVSGSSADYAAHFLDIEIPPRIVAGTLNLNNAGPEVLQTVIDGAILDASIAMSETLTVTARNDMSAKLGRAISGKPLGTGDGFVAAVWDAVDIVLSGTTSARNKAYGEATLRALSCVRNTGTWNLMIDVVAQTGVFPPNAPSTEAALNASFVVQGERRYWLHVAIDRVTGKVIDQQLEAVYE